KATGKPVRAVTRYADELTTTNPRHSSRIRLRTGVDADGRIVGHESRALFDGGAYAAGKPTVRLMVEGGISTLEGYRVPAALLERAANEIGATAPRPAGRGIGFALGVRHVGRGRTTISLRLDRDATIEARTGVGDQGGGQHTLIQRIVAATLGVDPRTVRVRRLSTEGPQDPGIGGSRVTPVHGGAALAAAQALKEKLGGRSVADAARALGAGEG